MWNSTYRHCVHTRRAGGALLRGGTDAVRRPTTHTPYTARHLAHSLLPADELLMRATNWMVNTPAIYGGMKLLARQIMIDTAEKKGVSWKATVAELERNPEVRRCAGGPASIACCQGFCCFG